MKRTVEEKTVILVAEVDPETGMLKILKAGPGSPKGFMKRAVAAARKGISFPPDVCDSDALGLNEHDLRRLVMYRSQLYDGSSRVSGALRDLSKAFPALVQQEEVKDIVPRLELIVTRLDQTVEAAIEKIKNLALFDPEIPASKSI